MKRILVLLMVMSISVISISCEKYAGLQQQGINNQLATNNNQSKIAVYEAKNIALKHANLDSSQVSFIKSELDLDDVIQKYDIGFYYDNKEYDYEINAITGEIIGYDYDVEMYTIPVNVESNNQIATNNNQGKIAVEEAKNIALKHANLDSSQVSFIKSELDLDDGIQKYDIEFYYDNKEYNYEISAINGSIIEYEIDQD